MSQIKKFSQLAKLGKNDWWRYLLGFAIIAICYLLVGGVLHLTLQIYLTHKYTNLSVQELIELLENSQLAEINESFTQVPVELQGLTLFSGFVVGLLAVLFVVKVIHKRAIKTLFTNRSKFSYSHFLHGFLVFLLITIISTYAKLIIYSLPKLLSTFSRYLTKFFWLL